MRDLQPSFKVQKIKRKQQHDNQSAETVQKCYNRRPEVLMFRRSLKVNGGGASWKQGLGWAATFSTVTDDP